MKKTQKGKT